MIRRTFITAALASIASAVWPWERKATGPTYIADVFVPSKPFFACVVHGGGTFRLPGDPGVAYTFYGKGPCSLENTTFKNTTGYVREDLSKTCVRFTPAGAPDA